MSSDLYKAAYATRLGNLTAKSVLVKICDHSNPEGFGYPSIATIAFGAEISERMVLRVIEVFGAIGLAERKKATIEDRYGRRTGMVIFLNMEMLGADLAECFDREYAKAQGKCPRCRKAAKKCRCDSEGVVATCEADVAATVKSVVATETGVVATLPPDPLLGRTTNEPSLNHQAGEGETATEPEKLTHEQELELAKLEYAGYPTAERRLELLAENLATAAALAAEEARLREMYPNRAAAIAKLRKQCGFAWAHGDLLGPVIEQLFCDQEELGRKPWQVASQIVATWTMRRKQGWRYGPVAFFRNGAWMGG